MRREEHRWLFDHLDIVRQFTGEWIAVLDDEIIAHGKDFQNVMDEGRKIHPNPLLIWVREDIGTGGAV